MLSDRDIRLAYGYHEDIRFHPPLSDTQFQPASVDLYLGNEFIKGGHKIKVSDGEHMTIGPAEFMLATTSQSIRLSNRLVARVEGKSSLGRLGLMVHITAGFIDPGFCGQITLELYNVSPDYIDLSPGQSICQLSFDRLETQCARPYGHPALGSHYQNQFGATPSVLEA